MSRIAAASSVSLALLLGVAACDSADDRASGELGQRLATPTTLALRSSSSAAIRGVDASGHDVEVGPLVVTGGDLTVQRTEDGDLAVQHLAVHLGDIVADDGALSGHPVTLTDVTVSLAGTVVLANPWSVSGQAARGGKHAQLRLDWALVDEAGRHVDIAPYSAAHAPLGIELLAEADGSVSAHVTIQLTGQVMGNWGVELHDFAMDLAASDGE